MLRGKMWLLVSWRTCWDHRSWRSRRADGRVGIWRNREDAAAGGGGPWHKQARAAAREMYDRITFHTHKLVIEEDVKGWSLEDYVG